MTEDTQPTETGGEAVTETLDDVISEYNIQEPPRQAEPSQQPVQAPMSQPVIKVDPLDENSFNQYATSVQQNQSALTSQIREMEQKLTQLEQRDAELQVETEINNAVKTVGEGLELDPKLVRVHLEYTAQEKPGFKRVWENRHNDPKTYTRALKAVQKEMAELYNVKQDPNLTETQTAIRQSQRSLASKTQPKTQNPIEERLSGAKSQAEFDREWQRMIGG